MHLPDGFLDAKTWTALATAGTCGVALALRKIKMAPGGESSSRQSTAPIVGLSAAFVFAAQMVNFPVAAALSGHLLGGTLLAILHGPWMASLVMTAVLVLQALLFQDGGITALGANVVNLAFLSTFCGYGIYRLLAPRRETQRRPTPPSWSPRRAAAIFIAAWASAVIAALAAAAELALSGTAPLPSLLALMGGAHALIGVGEGLVTVLVLRSLFAMGVTDSTQLQQRALGSLHHG